MPRRSSVQNDDRGDQHPGDGGLLEAAAFISQSVEELTQLAHHLRLDVLGFLLDMALLEARDVLRNRLGKLPD